MKSEDRELLLHCARFAQRVFIEFVEDGVRCGSNGFVASVGRTYVLIEHGGRSTAVRLDLIASVSRVPTKPAKSASPAAQGGE